jgi:hypothetical protein
MLFEHFVYKAVFGCLLWLSALVFNVGRPNLKSLQLFGIDHGQVKPMGWKTELVYMTVAQIIAEKTIGIRSPTECLHTALWSLYALLSTFFNFAVQLFRFFYAKWTKYIRNQWYRFQGIEIPVPRPKSWYSYKRLQDRHIRLLLIHRKFSFRVTYHLIDVALEDVPRYEAISYTWGDSTPTEEVTIDNKAFCIPRSVADVLRRRSKIIGLWPGSVRAVWIDYLCINQEDVAEKNRQVPMMREIYQQAIRTMVCLGDGPDASKANWLLIKLETMAKLHSVEELSKRYMLEKNSPSWLALGRMMSHPWFNRIWIVQEVATANRVFVTYGGGLIEWGLVYWAFCLFANPEMALLLPATDVAMRREMALSLEHVHVINHIREATQNKTSLSLLDALSMCTRFGAKDPRDKIFALLGLVTHNLAIPDWVDYNKSTEEVYRSTTRYLLSQTSDSLCVLNYAGIGHPWELASLPSWVPDWSSPLRASPFETAPRYLHRYNASGGRSHDPNILLNAGLNIIRLTGVHVDKIGIIAQARNMWLKVLTDEERDNSSGEMASWFKELQNLTEQHCPNPYHTGQTRGEALWRSIHGDRTVEGRPAPAILGDYYQAVQTLLLNNPPVQSDNYGATTDLTIKASRFISWSASTVRGRRFAVSKYGYMGWVPPLTEVGDLICIFAGVNTPFVVRPHKRGEGFKMAYVLVGACYLNGMMDGEMWDVGRKGETFTIC